VAVDVNVVGGGRSRAKRLLAADMESTIIEQELIDEIGALAGRREEIARITAATMRGEHDFAQSLIARVALFEGLEVARLLALLERATLTPGALTLVRTMAAGGAATALVSGGFTLFAEPIAARVGFDHVSANVLEVANGRLTGRVRMPILDAAGKSDTLVRLARERGIGLDETLAVGDGANDLAMIRTAGLGVAFRPKPMLAQAARSSKGGAVVAHGDLTAVLNLQGYAQEAFRG
jgi:phosphoserine phosphatase